MENKLQKPDHRQYFTEREYITALDDYIDELEAMIDRQVEQWTEGCKCSEDEQHGETWCCNNCGKPCDSRIRQSNRQAPTDAEIYSITEIADEYEQAKKRGGTEYAEAYIEGLQDGAKALRDRMEGRG